MLYLPNGSSYNNLSMDEVETLYLKSISSYEDCAKIVFPNAFSRKFDTPHLEVFELLENKKPKDKKAIMMPRGAGKTIITLRLVPAMEIFRGTSHYIVPISYTLGHAQNQAESLKDEFKTNRLINYFYGEVEFKKANQDQWVIKIADREHIVMPRGSGSQVRGMLYGIHRPDFIVFDDLEDPENLLSQYQREKQADWFWGDLGGCFELGSTDYRWIGVGTMVHPQCLIYSLRKEEEWDFKLYELCDSRFKSNFPNAMDDEACETLFRELKRKGRVHVFAREYRNTSVIKEEAIFKQKYFIDYNEDEEAGKMTGNEWFSFVIADPARTAKMESCESGFMGVSVNVRTRKIRVRRCRGIKVGEDGFFDELFEIVELLRNCSAIAIEVDGLEDWIMNPLMTELTKRGLYSMEVISLKARKGIVEDHVASADEIAKLSRVKQMKYYYKAKFVEHNPQECESLEQKLLTVPNPEAWDELDCLGYIPYVLQEANAWLGTGGEGTPKPEDSMEERLKDLEAMEMDDYLVI